MTNELFVWPGRSDPFSRHWRLMRGSPETETVKVAVLSRSTPLCGNDTEGIICGAAARADVTVSKYAPAMRSRQEKSSFVFI